VRSYGRLFSHIIEAKRRETDGAGRKGMDMESVWFHLLVIPGVFLLGRLSASLKVAGFRTERPVRKRSRFRF
jgi:hypothetical protein